MKYTKIDLVWNNLSIKSSDNYLILDNISGTASSSSLTILIGSIGTGKSSLMNILSGNIKKKLKISGEVSLIYRCDDTSSPNSSTISLVDDTFDFYILFSVYETIFLAVKFFNIAESTEYLDAVTSSIINLLDISYIKNTYLINLSQGERKLVSIGVILSEDPSIILLDEPFDFLDRYHIKKILHILKKLSTKSKTVFLTMNSPYRYILRECDQIYILGYKSVMFRGSYKEYLSFFNLSNRDTDEVVIDILSIDYTKESNKIRDIQKIEHVRELWMENSRVEYGKVNEGDDSNKDTQSRKRDDDSNKDTQSRKRDDDSNKDTQSRKRDDDSNKDTQSRKRDDDSNKDTQSSKRDDNKCSLKKIKILFGRLVLNFFRSRDSYLNVLFQKSVFLILSCLVYPFIGYSQEDIQTRIGLLGFLILNSIDRSMSIVHSSLLPCKSILGREISVGMYNSTEGYISYYLYSFCVIYFSTILYIIPVYWITRIYNNLYHFVLFLINHFCLANFIVSYSLLVGIISKSSKTAHVVGSVGLMICSAFSGIFVNVNTIPSWSRWMTWLSPLYYALEFSLQISLSNLVFKCDKRSCFMTGKEVLEDIGMNRMNHFIALGIFIFYIIGIILLGIFMMSMYYRRKIKY
jgi:ABC-type multidrug transport system ATPase subunit/ABC-type polysaccharide/polyol phosphate export permease